MSPTQTLPIDPVTYTRTRANPQRVELRASIFHPPYTKIRTLTPENTHPSTSARRILPKPSPSPAQQHKLSVNAHRAQHKHYLRRPKTQSPQHHEHQTIDTCVNESHVREPNHQPHLGIPSFQQCSSNPIADSTQ
ncbi:hypothetical protein P153DRAFT_386850 [Dothidotthia symphoricarpi CBS 119687]|uniref:Uncharacterized protein n=1 Tax=Dothidotthia symphoricarpi CBS 119687 TaxID=1392245 RepID=A0A6A6A9W5_9PLEO|nr:uncharacterized protein P153DRAFT_386850 [Dothidotthia symphoricarpi CBS 119687]KAF2127874.1 hypothetical protein P153DRAFT_386850 [Dothidotthia symphoricarpi CBS 119687]